MSDKSRRNLLKSIAAGSGAIIAGKSLPDSWSRPVVDSVMLPAHALTSGCNTIIIDFNISATGSVNGGAGYNITRQGNCEPIDGDGGDINGGIDETVTHTYGPGQYIVDAGFGGTIGAAAAGSVSGLITVSCCNGDTVTVADATFTQAGDFSDGGCALVTLGEDGSCMVELLSDCPCDDG